MSEFSPTTSKKRVFLQVGLLLGVVCAVFWRALSGELLIWDDLQLLKSDPGLQTLSFENFLGLWSRVHDMLYIPTVQSVWFLNGLIFGQWDPVALHATNLVFHSLNCVLVFRLLVRLMPQPSVDGGWFAFLGALVFAVHPMRVEAVAWVAGVKEVLAASAGLGALLVYLHSRESEQQWLAFRGLSLVLMFLSLAAKPSFVILPVCLVLLEWRPGFAWREIAARVSPYLALGAAFTALAVATQEPHQLLYVPPLWGRVVVALDAVGFYLAGFLVPWSVAPDYGRSPEFVLSSVSVWLPFVVVCLVALIGVLVLRSRDALRVAALFVVSLLPVLGFVPFYFQQTSTVADRYMYFPSVWLSLGLVLVLCRSQGVWKRLVITSAAVLVCFSGYRSSVDSGFWRDDRTFFTWMLEQNPKSFTALNRLADIAIFEGKFQESLDLLMASRAMAPWQPYPWLRSAFVMWQLGRREESIETLRALVAKYPGYKPAEENLQRLLQMQ